MATIGYDTIRDYAAVLAERIPLSIDPTAGLPDSENLILAQTFANELPDLWNREAWPELCAVASTALTDGAFTKNTTTMGEILGIYDTDPRSRTTGWQLLDWQDDETTVRVMTMLSPVYVDYQSPPTSLDGKTEAQLTATTLPARFRRPLALLGAAALLDAEDPQQAARYRRQADTEINKQASRIQPAWWRCPRAYNP